MALEITDYHVRTAPEDLDTIEICPAYPDLMVFGTYSLVGREREYDAQVRRGIIEVIPVSPVFQPAYPGMLLPKLAKRFFSAAVLDIHFHPEDKTLLGAALSNGQLHFFRFLRRGDVLGRRIITELLPLGRATVAEVDQDGLVPLVTQFVWLSCVQETGRRDVSNSLTVSLAATLSSHDVKILKVRVPGIKSTNDPRLSRVAVDLPVHSDDIHGHDLEAWTVSSLRVLDFEGSFQHILFSGGDDSRLIASMVEQNNCSSFPIPRSVAESTDLPAESGSVDTLLTAPPTLLFSDRKTHSAGVTSILPLPFPISQSTKQPALNPLLTGSYDESIYLHLLSPHNHRPTLITSLPLRGGVWRLKLMDAYTIPEPIDATGPRERVKETHKRCQTNYIVLASCMHAGVKILRITHTPTPSPPGPEWKIEIEALFTKGHETLVYASDFRKEWLEHPHSQHSLLNGRERSNSKNQRDAGHMADNSNTTNIKNQQRSLDSVRTNVKTTGDVGRYTVVSTSFYDRRICVWEWMDKERKIGMD